MTGLVIAGIALLILIFFLKTNFSVSEEELEEVNRIKAEEKAQKAQKAQKAKLAKQAKKDNTAEEEPKHLAKRALRTDKATEMLVQIMEVGSVKEIRNAMKNGINILQKLEENQTLLMIAVKNNPDVNVVKFLLEQGIEINAADNNGQTALILATAFNSNPEIIKTLLENGADKTIKDKSNKIAADYVVLNSSFFGTEIPALLNVQ